MLVQPQMWRDVVEKLKEQIGFDDLTSTEQKKMLPKIEAAAREAIRNHGREN